MTVTRRFGTIFALTLAVLGVQATLTVSARAQTTAAEGPAIGPVTDLPLPRFVSLKGAQAHVRRGPAFNHRIDWVYERRGLPLRVVGEHDVWRRVEDVEGEGGWIHFGLLSGIRTVIVTQDMAPLRRAPRSDSLEVALLERGVIARILECDPAWCRLSIDGTRGWSERTALWGLIDGEILE